MKRIILSLLALAVAISTITAQSFFKPLPKLQPKPVTVQRRAVMYKGLQAPGVVTVNSMGDSIKNAVRPILNIAAYAEPKHLLMAGAGISYQHLKYVQSAGIWICIWSVSAMGWAGGSVAPKTPTEVVSYGIMFGAFNNMVMVGPALNDGHGILVVSLGINLNN